MYEALICFQTHFCNLGLGDCLANKSTLLTLSSASLIIVVYDSVLSFFHEHGLEVSMCVKKCSVSNLGHVGS